MNEASLRATLVAKTAFERPGLKAGMDVAPVTEVYSWENPWDKRGKTMEIGGFSGKTIGKP